MAACCILTAPVNRAHITTSSIWSPSGSADNSLTELHLMQEQDVMVYAHVYVYAHSAHVVLYWLGHMDVSVLNVLGLFMTSGLQCATFTMKSVTTCTVFLLLWYSGFWLAAINITTVLILYSHDESPVQDALVIPQITAPWKCSLTVVFLCQHSQTQTCDVISQIITSLGSIFIPFQLYTVVYAGRSSQNFI